LTEVFHDQVFDGPQVRVAFEELRDCAAGVRPPNSHLDKQIHGQALELVVGGRQLGRRRLLQLGERADLTWRR
jgi:hypothetical protein